MMHNLAMQKIRKVLAALRKADETFSLIDNMDRICLGISGGKDSLCLLKAMVLYGKFSHKDFKIVPICLDLGFPGFDPEPIKEFASSLGVELIVENSKDVYPILQAHTKPGAHVPCSICSRMKKAAINAAATKHHCNKVAFAHHKDDAIETLFMNMIHGGRVATFEPKMRLDRASITFIRPLILASEEDLRGMAKEENMPVMGKTCPADGFTEREWTKNLLQSIYKERPESIANLASMLYNYKDFVLYFSHLEFKENDGSSYSLKPMVEVKQTIDYANFASKNKLPLLKQDRFHLLTLKKHKIQGCISYSREPHRVIISSFSSVGTLEDQVAYLLRFMDRLSKEENPMEFVFKGKGYKKQFKSLGFAPILLNGKEVLSKKIFR